MIPDLSHSAMQRLLINATGNAVIFRFGKKILPWLHRGRKSHGAILGGKRKDQERRTTKEERGETRKRRTERREKEENTKKTL